MTNPELRAVPAPEDDYSDLLDQLNGAAPAQPKLGSWNPQQEGPGAQIAGRIVAAREVDGKWGTKPVLTIETPQGERDVWASHSVLKSELEKTPPAPGSRIAIQYDGTKTSKTGHSYHVYSIAVDSPLAVPASRNWVDVFNSDSKPVVAPVASDDLPF